MRVLVVGSGAREHALVWKISQSPLVDKIFCAPGNGGTVALSESLHISGSDIGGLVHFARNEKIDLTIVGPEAPLVDGIYDEFSRHRVKLFGPSAKAAQLEASKVFAKNLMAACNVPTADFKVFDNPFEAKKYIETIGGSCVVKADGLAAGKGVVVAETVNEAKEAVRLMMEERVFGDAGAKVVIEERLEGQEASILVLTDSKQVVPLVSSQDHKRIFDADTGPNTGGMGAYSPAPIVTPEIFNEILEKIIYRTINGLTKQGIMYQGILYAGVMLTKAGPKALEFNVRFGDPETQAILPRLESDLFEVMLATATGALTKYSSYGNLQWDKRACVCVVCASGGYPGSYKKDKEIFGLDEANHMDDIIVFHAGTKRMVDAVSAREKFFTSGGRVLGVTGLGATIEDAITKTYRAVEKIGFDGMHYRRDIGKKAL